MGIPTEENKHQSDFDLDRMLERMLEEMRKIIEDSLNNYADQYSEEDEQAKTPAEEGCVGEMAKIGMEKTAPRDRLTVTTPTEQFDSDKIVVGPTTCIVNFLPEKLQGTYLCMEIHTEESSTRNTLLPATWKGSD